MKIGSGGKIGPFRGGISTRGVGAGFGPFSIGTGSGRRKSGSIWPAIGYLVVICWPMILVSVIMSAFGEGETHLTTVLMWVAEGLWIALMLAVVVAWLIRPKARDRPQG